MKQKIPNEMMVGDLVLKFDSKNSIVVATFNLLRQEEKENGICVSFML